MSSGQKGWIVAYSLAVIVALIVAGFAAYRGEDTRQIITNSACKQNPRGAECQQILLDSIRAFNRETICVLARKLDAPCERKRGKRSNKPNRSADGGGGTDGNPSPSPTGSDSTQGSTGGSVSGGSSGGASGGSGDGGGSVTPPPSEPPPSEPPPTDPPPPPPPPRPPDRPSLGDNVGGIVDGAVGTADDATGGAACQLVKC